MEKAKSQTAWAGSRVKSVLFLSSVMALLLTASGGGGNGDDGGGATVHPNFVGTHSTLTYQKLASDGCDGAACTYTDGQPVPVTIGADSSFAVGGKTLTDPYTKNGNLAEIVWRDGNLEYALSLNTTGVFNEINLVRVSDNKWLGQIREPAAAGPDVNALLAAAAGSYNQTLPNSTGISWHQMTLGADGALSFIAAGTGPDIASGDVESTAAGEDAEHNTVITITSKTDLNGDGTTGTNDQVKLVLDSDGKVKEVHYLEVHPTAGKPDNQRWSAVTLVP